MTSLSNESGSAGSTEWGFTLGEAVRSRAGWVVASGTALYSLIHTAVFFSILPICHERGLSDADAAGVLSAFAVSLAVMHILGGTLADRLPANWLLSAGMAGLALAMAAVFMMNGAWSARIAGVVLGLSRDHLGSFNPAVLAFAVAPLPLALLSLLATPPLRVRLGQDEAVGRDDDHRPLGRRAGSDAETGSELRPCMVR